MAFQFGSTGGATQPFGQSAFGGGQTAQISFGQNTPSAFGSKSTPAFGSSTTAIGFGSTGGFGSTATPAFGSNTTNSAFGSATTPAFGSAATGNAFGSTTGTTGFGGFGSTTTTPAFGSAASTTTPSTGFGFGSSTAPAAGGFGGFGTTQQPAAGSATTPSFGGFGGFGSTTSTAPSFGTTAATGSTPSTTFGGFGTTSSTGFGTTPTPSFGTTPSATINTFGSFGTTPATNTFGGFGTGTTTGSWLNPSAGQQQQQQQQQQPTGEIFESLQKLRQFYSSVKPDPNNPAAIPQVNDECAFKTISFQPKSDPTAGGLYPSTDHKLWHDYIAEQNEKDNFDSVNFVATIEYGIDKLSTRFQQQNTSVEAFHKQTNELHDGLQGLQKNNEAMLLKVLQLKRKQLFVYHSLLSVLRKIEVLRCRGNPLQHGELVYRQRMIRIGEQLIEPYQALQNIALQSELQSVPQDNYVDNISEDDLLQFTETLKRQSEGLDQLLESLRKDVRDVRIMQEALHV